MGHAIAYNFGNFIPLCPKEFKRNRTVECERYALDMLAAYKDFGRISYAEYRQKEKEIKSAPHDDAISNIMTRLRKKIAW